MQMPWHNPLLQTEPKVLRKLLQLLQLPLHLLHQIREFRPQIVLHIVPKNRRQPRTSVHRLLVRETNILKEPHPHAQLLHARVQQVRVPVRWPVQVANPDAPEELERGTEAEVSVGEEEFGAAEDEAAGLVGGGAEVAGEEVEDRGDVGGVDRGGEEVGTVLGQAGDVGVGEGMGFEEVEGYEDVVDGVGEREVVGFGFWVDYG
ncbi:hypothetical protein SESBI_00235 [Sesbania bispinosa]|nr:hypothetical protein SESBI_00235 [Sesbania bispinosa]